MVPEDARQASQGEKQQQSYPDQTPPAWHENPKGAVVTGIPWQ